MKCKVNLEKIDRFSLTELKPFPAPFYLFLFHIVSWCIGANRLLSESLVLLSGVALWGPSVDLGDLFLQDSIDEAVAGKQVLANKLVGDDNGLECLSTATYTRKEHIVRTIVI